MLVNIAKSSRNWQRRCPKVKYHAVLRKYAHAGPVFQEINARSVPRLAPAQDVDLSTLATPVIWTALPRPGRSEELMSALRQGQDRLIEVELGRYDDPSHRGFDRVTMRLGQYLDWLDLQTTPGHTGSSRIGGRQVYLAQWRGADEVPSVKDVARPPAMLQSILQNDKLDLYQTSFFIGPSEAVTPLHYDPYMNCFHLQAASDPQRQAKHFLLLPPSVSDVVGLDLKSHRHGVPLQRNTSHIDFQIRRHPLSIDHAPFNNTIGAFIESSSDVNVDKLSDVALSCVLREGETLFIPRGWWHRVENIDLTPGRSHSSDMAPGGWTAGVAWWFLFR